ncbi:hypothetical protein U1Q18_047769 [Sarracenia purpurea var. burkii]
MERGFAPLSSIDPFGAGVARDLLVRSPSRVWFHCLGSSNPLICVDARPTERGGSKSTNLEVALIGSIELEVALIFFHLPHLFKKPSSEQFSVVSHSGSWLLKV